MYSRIGGEGSRSSPWEQHWGMTSQLPRLDLARNTGGWRRGAGAGAERGGYEMCFSPVVGRTFLGMMPSIIPVGLVVSVMAPSTQKCAEFCQIVGFLFGNGDPEIRAAELE